MGHNDTNILQNDSAYLHADRFLGEKFKLFFQKCISTSILFSYHGDSAHRGRYSYIYADCHFMSRTHTSKNAFMLTVLLYLYFVNVRLQMFAEKVENRKLTVNDVRCMTGTLLPINTVFTKIALI